MQCFASRGRQSIASDLEQTRYGIMRVTQHRPAETTITRAPGHADQDRYRAARMITRVNADADPRSGTGGVASGHSAQDEYLGGFPKDGGGERCTPQLDA